MTGLSVLYARQAKKEKEWATIPERDRPGRLREVYWARRAVSKSGCKKFFSMGLTWQVDRTDVGRDRNDPGDGFVYLVEMSPRVEQRFEWLEVTEEFPVVSASQIESAMRELNGIPGKHPFDLCKFRKGLDRGRPSRMAQRVAADQIIARIEKKLRKASYAELLERYGYGTLVVGMPLWFAVPPDDPFRAENALDNFMTRTALGLEEIRRAVLRRRDCPFGEIIVLWDVTPQALRAWRESRSPEYEDSSNVTFQNPMGAMLLGVLTDSMQEALSIVGIPESEAPSMCLHICVMTRKKATGVGPFPKLVEVFRKVLPGRDDFPYGLWSNWKLRIAGIVCKLLCFIKFHGVKGLVRRISRKFSAPYRWRINSTRRRARQNYLESKRRTMQ